MISMDIFESDLKKNSLRNSYVFFGIDEFIIKEGIDSLVHKSIDENFKELNLIRLDGNNIKIENVINACETLPFMSEKKVVEIYRANFLREKVDKESLKLFEEINSYLDNLPPYCILILYYLAEDDREKPSKKLNKIDKKTCVVKADKLKGDKLYKKVQSMFEIQGKSIEKSQIKFFCENVDNNMSIISSEIDKLINYTEGREIKKEDIIAMLPYKSNNDIFNLVDFLSQKRPEKAISILNELIFRGEEMLAILSMIERQFKLLFNIKAGMENHKDKVTLARELNLNPFICEKLMSQSKKFSLKQLKKCMELCLNTERNIKTSTIDKKTEIEMLIISTALC